MSWRYRITSAWWKIVKRLNLRAYLRHAADNPNYDAEAIEALLCLDTDKWTRRGAKVNVWVGDIALPEDATTHWKTAYDGSRYLPWDTLRKFQKIVEDAEYERGRRRREGRELRVKYFTAIAAALAALASLTNLYFSYRRK